MQRPPPQVHIGLTVCWCLVSAACLQHHQSCDMFQGNLMTRTHHTLFPHKAQLVAVMCLSVWVGLSTEHSHLLAPCSGLGHVFGSAFRSGRNQHYLGNMVCMHGLIDAGTHSSSRTALFDSDHIDHKCTTGHVRRHAGPHHKESHRVRLL